MNGRQQKYVWSSGWLSRLKIQWEGIAGTIFSSVLWVPGVAIVSDAIVLVVEDEGGAVDNTYPCVVDTRQR